MFTPIDINEILDTRVREIALRILELDPHDEVNIGPLEELYSRHNEVTYLRDIVFPRSLV